MPADRPIVAALRLPERLTQVFSRDYAIDGPRIGLFRDMIDTNSTGAKKVAKLHGVFCSGCDEAVATAGAGADFLVMRNAVADGELTALCESVDVPVYARGIALEEAWALGASGVSEINV